MHFLPQTGRGRAITSMSVQYDAAQCAVQDVCGKGHHRPFVSQKKGNNLVALIAPAQSTNRQQVRRTTADQAKQS